MASISATEKDLRRDEARLHLILAGGRAPPEAELPPSPQRPRFVVGAAALALIAGAAAGVAWLERAPEAAPPTEAVAPIAKPAPVPLAPPLPVASPSPVPVAPGVPDAAKRPRPRRVAHARTRPVAPPPRASASARPARPSPALTRPESGSRWIAEPLYGDALRRAQEADARRAAALNSAELRRLPPPPGD